MIGPHTIVTIDAALQSRRLDDQAALRRQQLLQGGQSGARRSAIALALPRGRLLRLRQRAAATTCDLFGVGCGLANRPAA